MSDLIGQSLGRYHILEQLGEGGMATVYKAYDTRLETDVAVKVIRTENILPSVLDRALKRFEREAKALAKLNHPNIVKVIDYGEYGGKPYLVMPYFPGGTLKQKLGKPIPWQEAIQILLPIAEALDYAHSQNMVHRDVKPSNILLTERGQLMLTDFGIAKVLDVEETMDLTGTSAAMGTPEYMAPEQATAKTADHRADIYALGIVLYEMVTGRKPYTADTPMAVLIKQATDPLPRPTKFVPSIPDSAEKLLLKALAKDPADRYQSMAEMAAAMESLQGKTSKQVKKAPRQKKEKREKASSKQKWVTPVIITVILLGLVLAGVFGLPALQPQPEKTPEPTQNLVIQTEQIPTPMVVETAINVDNPTSVDTITPEPTATPEPRWITWDGTTVPWPDETISSNNLESLNIVIRIQNVGAGVTSDSIKFSPNNDYMFYGYGTSIYIRQIANGSTDILAGHSNGVTCIDISSDGNLLVSGSREDIRLWNLQERALIFKFENEKNTNIRDCRHIAFSPNDSIVAASNTIFNSDRGVIQVWNVEDPSPVLLLDASDDEVSSFEEIVFSTDGKYLAASTSNDKIYIWNTEDFSLETKLEASTTGLWYWSSSIAFSPDGTQLVFNGDGDIWIWNTSDWSLIQIIDNETSQGGRVIYSRDGKILISDFYEGWRSYKTIINFWQVSDGALLRSIEVDGDIISMGLSNDGVIFGYISSNYLGNNRYNNYFGLLGILPKE